MKLLGVDQDLPERWGGFECEEFMQMLARYEGDLPFWAASQAWALWCKIS